MEWLVLLLVAVIYAAVWADSERTKKHEYGDRSKHRLHSQDHEDLQQ